MMLMMMVMMMMAVMMMMLMLLMMRMMKMMMMPAMVVMQMMMMMIGMIMEMVMVMVMVMVLVMVMILVMTIARMHCIRTRAPRRHECWLCAWLRHGVWRAHVRARTMISVIARMCEHRRYCGFGACGPSGQMRLSASWMRESLRHGVWDLISVIARMCER